MKAEEFNDYEKACEFCDKTGGQIQWCSYKRKNYWIVWY